jgi:hypothetical protein
VNPASFDSTPSEVGIGTLRLHGWQARRVTPLPVTCEPYDGYLIKAGYDLEIEPGAQAPSWFRSDSRWAASSRTALQSIRLPAVAPIVDVFGLGGLEIRWRHTGGARHL